MALSRKEISHNYYLNHKIEILSKKKIYNKLKAIKIAKQRKEYYLKNKLKVKKLHNRYYKKFLKRIKIYSKNYNNSHKKEKQIYNFLYYKKNKSKINKKRNIYFIKRRKVDINFKIKSNLRIRIWETLKNNSKSKTTIKLVNCSLNFLKNYLESKFLPGMNWNNYGKWHIDHIKPCASFDLSKHSEQRKCFHYSNLQPLWGEDNLRKSNKY